MTTYNLRIQVRRDSQANWEQANPKLLAGEFGLDLTNHKLKIGDGEKLWSELDYVTEAVEESLAAEVLRATAAEEANVAAIEALTTTVNDNAESISASLAAETVLRVEGDAANSLEVTAETARATTAEAALQAEVDANETNIANNSLAIDSETARAAAAESALDTRLDILEVDPTTQGSIDAEASRALAAEAALDVRVDLLEIDPTTQGAVDSVSARVATLEGENHQDAIDANTSAIDENATAIANEVSRAQAAEALLAPLDDAALTGTVTVDGNEIATGVYVDDQVDALANGAVASNTAAIASNVSDIADNAADIATNTAAIATLNGQPVLNAAIPAANGNAGAASDGLESGTLYYDTGATSGAPGFRIVP